MTVLYDRVSYQRYVVKGIDHGLPHLVYNIDPPVHIVSITETLSLSTQQVSFGDSVRLPWSAGWMYHFEATKILRQLLDIGRESFGMNDAIVVWATDDEPMPGKVPLVKIAVCLVNNNFDASDGVPNDSIPPWDTLQPHSVPDPPKSQWQRLIDD